MLFNSLEHIQADQSIHPCDIKCRLLNASKMDQVTLCIKSPRFMVYGILTSQLENPPTGFLAEL